MRRARLGILGRSGIKPLIEKRWGCKPSGRPRGRDRVHDDLLLGKFRGNVTFHRDDPTRIHHLERDSEFLIELPKHVQILKICASHGNTGGGDR
jgi:hypothetical protein